MTENQTRIKKPQRAITIRAVAHIAILSLLALSFVVASFAWIRNYFDMRGTNVKTGRMLYSFDVYVRDSESGSHIKVDTYTIDMNSTVNTTTDHFERAFSVDIDLRNTGTADAPTYDEVFYVVKKLEGSIDLDVSLRFSIEEIENSEEELAEQSDFLNAIKYNKLTERTFGDDYWTALNENDITENASSAIDLLKDYTTVPLDGENDCCVIRVKFGETTSPVPQHDNLHFNLRARLGVSQHGAPEEGEEAAKTITIANDADLINAMGNYKAGQTLRITQNIIHSGDLVFVKPVTIILDTNVQLTVFGNMMFSYKYDGKFVIDTRARGQIFLAAQLVADASGEGDKPVGGNLYIDTPYSSFDFYGVNNSNPGKADMYIQGEVTIQASIPTQRNEDEKTDGDSYGVYFTRINIGGAEAKSSPGANLYDTIVEPIDALKPITISGETRVYVSSQTKLGALKADKDCLRIIVVNYGTIQSIDLREMTWDIHFQEIDNIYVEHHGTVTENTIRLPFWSYKRTTTGEDNPNTRIISHSGGSNIYAVTGDKTLEPKPGAEDNSFYSYGENHTINDIEYVGRPVLVEVVGDDITKIIVHYETPTNVTINQFPDKLKYTDENGVEQTVGGSLKSFIDYYSNENTSVTETGGRHIAPFDQLTEVTVICYGDKAITAADYEFLRTLVSVTKLDLSQGSSWDDSNPEEDPIPNRVPSYAFSDGDTKNPVLPDLTELKMPDADTVWGMYLFTGCPLLDEIAFPGSLTEMEHTLSGGNVNHNSLSDSKIHYIYTSAIFVKGLYKNSNEGRSNSSFRFYFTPESVWKSYADLYSTYGRDNDSNYRDGVNAGRRFAFAVTNKLTRHGYYFLELDEESRTCKFITYGGAVGTSDTIVETLDLAKEKEGNYRFDLSSITVDNVKYTITEYADYALTNRLMGNMIDVTFDEKLTKIGAYAFFSRSTTVIRNVEFKGTGTLTVGRGAFYRNINGTLTAPDLKKIDGSQGFYKSLLTELSMPSLVEIAAPDCFCNCGSLTKIDLPSLTTISGLISVPGDSTDIFVDNKGTFYGCYKLVTAYMPKLTTVIGTNSNAYVLYVYSSSNLARLDISVIPYINGVNRQTMFQLGSKTLVVVHHEHAGEIPEGATQAGSFSNKQGHVLVDSYYKDYYPQLPSTISGGNNPGVFSNAIYINNFDADNIKAASYDVVERVVDYNSTPHEITSGSPDFYFYDNGNGTAKLLAYIGASINTTGDYTTPAEFTTTDNRKLSVTSIEASSYSGISMDVAGKLTFPVAVTEIGSYAFYQSKEAYELDLNQVEKIGYLSFYNAEIYRIYGEHLHTADSNSMASMRNLVYVYLPMLTRDSLTSSNSYIFYDTSNIRFAYTGASPNINYTSAQADIWLVNCTAETIEKSYTANSSTNMFLNDDVSSYFSTSYSSGELYYAGANFQNLVLADWFDYKVTVNGVAHTMRLPGYAFVPKGSDYEMRLAAIEVDSIKRACSASGGDYTTPESLYLLKGENEQPVTETIGNLTFNAYSTQGEGTEDCIVKDMAKNVFSDSSMFSTVKNLTIGKYIESLPDSLFSGKLSSMTGTLNLQNVKRVGRYCFSSNGKIRVLLAPNLEQLDIDNTYYQSYAFANMDALTRLELPKIKKIEKYAFQSCDNLVEVVLGDDCTSIATLGFGSCGSLKKVTVGKNFSSFALGAFDYSPNIETITIFAERRVSFSSTILHDSSNETYYAANEHNIKVIVSAAYLNEYQKSATYSYNGKDCVTKYLPIDNFETFDKANTVEGIKYYWSVSEGGTAKISKIESNNATNVVIPNKFLNNDVNYMVAYVDRSAISGLAGVIELTLPVGLQGIDFTTEHLPATLTAIHIPSDTTEYDSYRRFASIDGVLYNSDRTVLLMCPVAYASSTFTVPNSVELIAAGAFKNAANIESVTIGSKLNIASEAFANTTKLHTVTFTATVAENVSSFIGRDTFLGGNGRLRIDVNQNLLDDYKNKVLLDMSVKERIVCSIVDENGITYYVQIIDEDAKTLCITGILLPATAPTTIDLPETIQVKGDAYTVISISANATVSLSGVETVHLPDTMSELEFSARDLPSSIKELVIGPSNTAFATWDGVLYSKDYTTLIIYPAGKTEIYYSIPLEVQVIEESAFYNAQSLKYLFIGSKVEIRSMAFAYTNALQRVYFYNVNDTENVSKFTGTKIFSSSGGKWLYFYVPNGYLNAFKEATPNYSSVIGSSASMSNEYDPAKDSDFNNYKPDAQAPLAASPQEPGQEETP